MLAVGLKQIVDGHRDRVCAAVLLAPITMHPEYVPEKYKERYVAYDENWDGPLINKEAMAGFFGKMAPSFPQRRGLDKHRQRRRSLD
jgi:hypothetical protein